MAPSKSTRIIILLAIDSAFFLLELIVGELGSCLSRAILLVAELMESQALPYTHWPSSPTPFIWSVIIRSPSQDYHLRILILTTRCCSSTMSSRSVSDCGRSKWHIKNQARRCTHMGYVTTRIYLTPDRKCSNSPAVATCGNIRGLGQWSLPSCSMPIHFPRGNTKNRRTANSLKSKTHPRSWMLWPPIQHPRPVSLP